MRSKSKDPFILVIGATGYQGGSTARLLLQRGHRVRVMVLESTKAKYLEDLGANVCIGDLSMPDTVEAALENITAVFSVPIMDHRDPYKEYRYAVALIEAAQRAGVNHFVQTSVAGTGDHKSMSRAGTGYWNDSYWEIKWQIEEAVRNIGFANFTIFKPTLFMENFMPPMVSFMYPDLQHGKLATAIKPETLIQFISVQDIGAFAAAAFEQPAMFNGRTIELASEALTMEEVAATLTAATGRKVIAASLSIEEGIAQGRVLVREDEWLNEVGHHAAIKELDAYGVRMTTFYEWAERHKYLIFQK